ncbi:hypothetical protein NQD34_004682 [Periophthalmus magnuspinnatus]|nr:hypothetical protein NQD34_004682 [Periophthalmus magnuspinnatus]
MNLGEHQNRTQKSALTSHVALEQSPFCTFPYSEDYKPICNEKQHLQPAQTTCYLWHSLHGFINEQHPRAPVWNAALCHVYSVAPTFPPSAFPGTVNHTS